MTTTQYVGARYVPLFKGEWDNTKTYEPLCIVSNQGNSYTSRQYVPMGIAIDNDEYWALTGNYNAQVDAYREEVKTLVNQIGFVTPEMFGAKGDGVTNDTQAITEAINTGKPCYFKNTTYLVDNIEVTTDTLYMIGDNTTLKANYNSGISYYSVIMSITNALKNKCLITSFNIEYTSLPNSYTKQSGFGITLFGFNMVEISNVTISNTLMNSILIRGSEIVNIHDCTLCNIKKDDAHSSKNAITVYDNFFDQISRPKCCTINNIIAYNIPHEFIAFSGDVISITNCKINNLGQYFLEILGDQNTAFLIKNIDIDVIGGTFVNSDTPITGEVSNVNITEAGNTSYSTNKDTYHYAKLLAANKIGRIYFNNINFSSTESPITPSSSSTCITFTSGTVYLYNSSISTPYDSIIVSKKSFIENCTLNSAMFSSFSGSIYMRNCIANTVNVTNDTIIENSNFNDKNVCYLNGTNISNVTINNCRNSKYCIGGTGTVTNAVIVNNVCNTAIQNTISVTNRLTNNNKEAQ